MNYNKIFESEGQPTLTLCFSFLPSVQRPVIATENLHVYENERVYVIYVLSTPSSCCSCCCASLHYAG